MLRSRMTPAVRHLTPAQMAWLVKEPYMKAPVFLGDPSMDPSRIDWSKRTVCYVDAGAEDWLLSLKSYHASKASDADWQKHSKDLTVENLVKLTFPGFRVDLGHLTQVERDKHVTVGPAAGLAGLFPPRAERRRPREWYLARNRDPPATAPHGRGRLSHLTCCHGCCQGAVCDKMLLNMLNYQE